MQTFDVSVRAVRQAMTLGLGDDPDTLVSIINNFARRSALVTHDEGNRRYGGYVLDVHDARVYSLSPFDAYARVCPECHGTGKHQQRDNGRWIDVPCQNPYCTEQRGHEAAYG